MTRPRYLDAVRSVLNHIEETQSDQTRRAAGIIASALLAGGAVRCAEIGHSLEHDFFQRAGGLAAVRLFTYQVDADADLPGPLRDRLGPARRQTDGAAVRLALRRSGLQAGDVILVSSVSGRSPRVIELSIAARELGMNIIGFTSAEYSAHVEPAHSSGKKLSEVVDVVIDIGAPYGDAAVSMEGFDYPVLPVSGPGLLCAGWVIWEYVMEIMAAAGTPPSVLISINRPEGLAHYEETRRIYNERGF